MLLIPASYFTTYFIVHTIHMMVLHVCVYYIDNYSNNVPETKKKEIRLDTCQEKNYVAQLKYLKFTFQTNAISHNSISFGFVSFISYHSISIFSVLSV